MRVLQINAIYQKYSTGRTTKELHEALIEKGIDSYVASPLLNGLNDHGYQVGCPLDWKVHALLSRILGAQGHYSKLSTLRLIKYIKTIKPEIIHLRNLHSNYINIPILLKYIAKADIPIVITLHDSWFYTGKCVYYIEYNCDKWKKNCGNCPGLHGGNNSLFLDRSEQLLKEKEALFSEIHKKAVIGVSNWVTEDARQSILANSNIIRCIYNWIDLDLFRPLYNDNMRKKVGLDSKFIILGMAMSWNRLKGIHIFEELAKLLDEEYQIILIGDCSQITKVDNIIYTGSITDVETLVRYYSMADVFVNPTIQETFGKTTAEAMACGTPVIAYNSTATPELIGNDGQCGYLVNKNRAEEYYKKIVMLQKNGKNKFSCYCRERAENLFSKEKNIESYIGIYKSLLNK